MHGSLEQFLEQVARRGSWIGGGSAAALSAALAAALLEKLTHQPAARRRLRGVRRQCLRLIQRDARTFARVIQATRAKNRQAFRRSLKAAIEVPCQVFEHAQAIHAACRATRRSINPRFHSDLHCAMALARASSDSARAFIQTNLSWLNEQSYSAAIHRRLRATASTR